MSQDLKNQLAQRLYLRDNLSLKPANAKSFRSESHEGRKLASLPLAPKIAPSLKARRLQRTTQLDPISPHIRDKITPKSIYDKLSVSMIEPQDSTPISDASMSIEMRTSIKKTAAKPKIKVKKPHFHGDIDFHEEVPPPNRKLNPFDVLHMLRFDPDLSEDFWYLNRKEGPYDFEFVNYNKRNPNEYLTISSRGVTYFLNGVAEFITIEEWHREYMVYQKLKDIPFFKQYKLWKNFSIWKNSRRRTMMEVRSSFLEKELFILDKTLRDAMFNVRTNIFKIMRWELIDLNTEEVRTIEKFNADQDKKRTQIASQLEEIENNIKTVVVTACRESMEHFHKENRTSIHKDKEEEEDEVEKEEQQDPFLVGDSSNKQMPYTQEAIIRTHYKRLSKYIRLCDYQIMDSKMSLSISSTQKVWKAITADYEKLRREARIRGFGNSVSPLLMINCNFEGMRILFEPDSEKIKLCLDETLMKAITVVCNNELLLSSPDFEKYTQMLEDFEDRQFEEDVDLLQMAINDENIRELDQLIKKGVENTFNKVLIHSEKYISLLEIYDENERTDAKVFINFDLDQFKKSIEKYKSQIDLFNELKEKEEIGIYQLNSKDLKDKLKPNPKSCLNRLETLMPKLAFDRAATLSSELGEANKKLAITPTNIYEYISYSKFLKEADERMIEFGSRFSDIKDLLQLMEGYGIKYPDETHAKYSDALSALNALRQRMQTAIERAESDKIRFTRELKDKITSVDRQVKDISGKLGNEMISDREAPAAAVVHMLKTLGEEVETVFNESKNYNLFQDQLEQERTNFEYVNDMRRDYRLKYEMWLALYEWSYKITEWTATPFSQIDVDSISKEVDNYFKIAMRSRVLEEQGNFVPEVLRGKVEALKNTMPAVIDLRCPALKQRHWDQIKDILNFDIDTEDPNFTLNTLIDMKVNDKKDEISDVALKAKKEQELERQLKEIIDSWEGIEFQLNYLKEKDAFILTSLEDIITQLEDTHVSLTSIITNRFIGPLYEHVEPWQKKFALFSSTLDEWMNVQKQWLYLETIFAAPDIIKQLPNEHRKFSSIDSNFRNLMKGVSERPGALLAGTQKGLLKDMKDWNSKLEQVQKALEDYLDKKRKMFPRFFFLSNDELLEILARTRNPQAVQPHLRKCFENIYQLDFGTESRGEDIYAMISAEGEKVPLSKNLKARGNVEEWLGAVEADMVKSLKREMKQGHLTYEDLPRPDWVLSRFAQIVACVCSIMWSYGTEEAMNNKENATEAMSEWYDTNVSQLEELTHLVRQDLNSIQRRSVVALVTQDVHNRDIIEQLKTNDVTSMHDFRWQQQLRYYWMPETDDCIIRQVNSASEYGYEYMGATTRLVITPLTDRCWMTITGALHIKLGAAPAGPAGTGKTESTKDLAKAMGKYCVVFNCSEQITHKMMEKLFTGLCYTGAWACLDEFNRIDIEVLSVIAQQLRTVRNAKLDDKQEFEFEGRLIKLMPSMGVFITMNPGYAGRTELPDNLKVLFRPVSMMVPDYTLIAEIMLFAEGFSKAKALSGKMTKLYKLSSEQLSQQDHYDFGMRAVKSVLNMAGALKRKQPDLSEEAVLIRAMRDSNVPKFLKDDLKLFFAIVQDLFPGVEAPFSDYSELENAIIDCMAKEMLEPEPSFLEKVIQLFETFGVRFGVMIVGPATAGKTTCYKVLALAMNHLRAHKSKNDSYQTVEYKVLNPKAITMGELYGEYNEITQDWKDGLASSIMRTFSEREDKARKWVVFDGPVDALWIENMNTVLDDNMMLCLANGQRIKLKNEMRMLFEVQDLAVASPATVSRCGMVYMNLDAVGWRPYMLQWVRKELADWPEAISNHVRSFFEIHTDKALSVIRKGLIETIPTLDMALIMSACSLFKALTHPETCPRLKDDHDSLKKYLDKVLAFCILWGIGGALDSPSSLRFDSAMSNELNNIELPKGNLYNSFVSPEKVTGEWRPWDRIKPDFIYDPEMSYLEIVVPTNDTVRFSYLLKHQIYVQKPIFITGETGVGKSVVIADTLNQMKENDNIFPVYLTFSAQTSSIQTQNSILSKLDSKRKDMLGGPGSKKVALLIDDVNMPAVEQYGAQPPIELMRQYCDSGYIYDRSKHFPIRIIDTTLICCAAPPEGGRYPLTQRFTRHFHMLSIPPTSEDSMNNIYKTILDGFFKPFKAEIQALSGSLTKATVNIYNQIKKELLPTPAKSHYTFNLRDVSKVFQGVTMSDYRMFQLPELMIKLWIHENCRVFHDRLINREDKRWFTEAVVKQLMQEFRKDWTHEEIFEQSPILFGDFIRGDVDPEDKFYEEITDPKKLTDIMNRYLEDYNYRPSGQMHLVFFQDALEHLCRLCRILRLPRGNAMLVGVGGSGKQSLTRLAAFICKCESFQIQITKSYTYDSFREDIKKLFLQTGGPEEKPTVFLISDNQIVNETFLEDINNILNSGEVPNLFTKEEIESLDQDLRPIAAKRKIFENMYNFFIQRVRSNLHLVLCMSPVGDALRVRMRKFPSLVNCCTIDWVEPWPFDALLNVSQTKMRELGFDDMKKDVAEKLRQSLARMCVEVHTSVEKISDEFHDVLNRKVYITPKSYLDMMSLYFKLLEYKSNELMNNRERYRIGVDCLKKTNEDVVDMQAELTKLAPVLENKRQEAEVLSKKVEADSVEANKVKEVAEAEEREVNAQAIEVQKIQKDAQADLDAAIPALESAIKALDQINPRDIAEIRTFSAPSALIKYTLEAVSIMLGEKPDWDSIKRTLQNDFINRLKNYPKDDIPKPTLRKIRAKIADNPDFTPEKVGIVNQASKSLCLWVFAMEQYAKISEEVAPKKERLDNMNKIFKEAMTKLQATRDRLQKELDKVANLERQRQAVLDERDRLDRDARTTKIRLERASVLTEGLKEENQRWELNVEKLTEQIKNVVGDVFISAACISYYGPFTGPYRKKLVDIWLEKCTEYGISVSPGFELQAVMGDPVTIREWNMQTLPTDSVSVNNGVIVTKSERWPLMIDPQEQANRWIRKMNERYGVKVVKQTDRDFGRVLENTIRDGSAILIEDVGETLDPSLDPVLEKNLIELGAGHFALRIGDSDIDYDSNFRLYITTKLPNPHYLPEVCIKTTLINFTVTMQGLEEQLLGDVVSKEMPAIEKKKAQLLINIAADQKKLKEIEDSILRSLTETKGNILDDAELIENLKNSKRVSTEINERMLKSEETKREVEEAREKYQPVAVRGSILYFVIADLAMIDPMYQYSLSYFTRLFSLIIETSKKSDIFEERLSILLTSITKIIYSNICRGLFNAHKLIFSFLIAVQILRNRGEISDMEWSLVLKGISIIPKEYKKLINPDTKLISDKSWDVVTVLQNTSEIFKKPMLGELISKNHTHWFEWISAKEPQDLPLPEPYENIPEFQKLLVIKAFREEKIIYSVIHFVAKTMGKEFVQAPPTNMEEVYQDTTARSPIIFILSQGADPMGMMQRLAEEKEFTEKMDVVSLGKGQGDRAKRMIEAGMKAGRWIVLQNCHLAKSWMGDMEKLVELFDEPKTSIHSEFRLFLTSMPCTYFPVPVLQNGVKITVEPPKGIKSNITRSLNTMTEESFEDCSKPIPWKKLLLSVSFFHAVVQERRKFGPLGWNIRYEFNESDLETSITVLKNFLNEQEQIPWDALKFVTGEINYGGRVTDDWDRRCLKNILDIFISPQVLISQYKFSESGTYYVPSQPTLTSYLEYVNSLPITDDPEIFGMHTNANITYQKQESDSILMTALSMQPKDTGKGSMGKSPDEIVDQLAANILENLPSIMSKNEAEADTFAVDKYGLMDSLATFLGQEMVRFNKLLVTMRRSLENLRKAIKGLVVMSSDLDAMYNKLLINQVPLIWEKVAYPSLRPLASWVQDLSQRVQFLRKWIRLGKPEAYWLSSFFFPQGFLTAILQSFARKYQTPIDILGFAFDFQPFAEVENITDVPEDGCLIYGLFMEGTRWDSNSMQLEDSVPGEMFSVAPIILFTPSENYTPDSDEYSMPVYKTSVRAGTLSTTGHSTNFIIAIDCPTTKRPQYWVLQGAAFLCQLND
jgi:dynein heavy chain